jgi:hypothetical protein
MNNNRYRPPGFQTRYNAYGAGSSYGRPGNVYGACGLVGRGLRAGMDMGYGNRYPSGAIPSAMRSPYNAGGAGLGGRFHNRPFRQNYPAVRVGGMRNAPGRSYPLGDTFGRSRYPSFPVPSFRSPLSRSRQLYPGLRSSGGYPYRPLHRQSASYPGRGPRYGTRLGTPYSGYGYGQSTGARGYPPQSRHLRRHSYPSAYGGFGGSGLEDDMSDNDSDDYEQDGDSDDDDDFYSRYTKKRPYKPSSYSSQYGYGTDYDDYEDGGGLDYSSYSGYGRPNQYRY